MKPSPVKAIYHLNQDHYAIVFTRGTILVYDQYFEGLITMVEVSHQETVFAVDCLQLEEKVCFAFLTKNKESHTVTTFEFKVREDFPLEKKKKVEEIGVNVHRFFVNFGYPKQFNEKLKAANKASLTLKLLPEGHLLLTSKFG